MQNKLLLTKYELRRGKLAATQSLAVEGPTFNVALVVMLLKQATVVGQLFVFVRVS